ncbi:adhesion G protein-coupled receptor L1-like [Anneissia japonica]|uniref:adhesion G protein-coupled receptor L1-like n=1 Tax=Anneissia japonica TaxID=1529436 RepID=UPI0014258860|nr:adhesion G protein-coupled receptor L1-like [Anneissia japonica]
MQLWMISVSLSFYLLKAGLCLPADEGSGDWNDTTNIFLDPESDLVLTSPNYPQDYNPSMKKVWRVTTASNYRIALTFSTIQLEPIFDSLLVISDGVTVNSSYINTWNTTLSCFELELMMITDDTVEYQGFHATLSTQYVHTASNDSANSQMTNTSSTFTMTRMFLSVCDRLLDKDNLQTISDSGDATNSEETSSNMVLMLETFALELANNIDASNASVFSYTSENLDMHIDAVPNDVIASVTSLYLEQEDLDFQCPTAVLSGDVKVVTVIPKTLHVSMSSQLEDGTNSTSIIFGSYITSLSVTSDKTIDFSDDPVEISIRHLQAFGDGYHAVCAFWKFSNNSTGGIWSTDGCEVVISETSKTVCRCNHLTNFAILMRVSPESPVLSVADATALEVLTFLLTSLSIISLVLTILTYIYLRIWNTRRNIVHINLASSLATAQILYLCLIERTENDLGCTFSAVILQYIFTVSFSWMLLEGVYLLMVSHSSLIRKNPQTSIYIAVGWATPLVFVAIPFIYTPSSYGSEEACWLDTNVIWAFVTPILFVIAVNVFVLTAVIKIFLNLKANSCKSKKHQLRSSIRAVLLMLPLMGLTWIFGLVASFDKSNFFAYMFVIFNSSQGICIFLQLIVFNDEIRKLYKMRYVQRGTNSTFITSASFASGHQTKKSFLT